MSEYVGEQGGRGGIEGDYAALPAGGSPPLAENEPASPRFRGVNGRGRR